MNALKIDRAHLVGHGEEIAGDIVGRQSDTHITVYKSLGVASQDLAAAQTVWRAAQAQGLGKPIALLD